jgi:hypothetical protein
LSQLVSLKLCVTGGSTRLCSQARALICRAARRFKIKSAASVRRPPARGALPRPARRGEVPHQTWRRAFDDDPAGQLFGPIGSETGFSGRYAAALAAVICSSTTSA